MTDSSVKVGVRIRPLLQTEKDHECAVSNYDSQSVSYKNQTFTYDYVFGPELSQKELYEGTAAPMLKSFLEGYNVTIMAYGQTGSGKTFTMGTSDANMDDVANQGLIPRFVCDLFENLKLSSPDSQKVESKATVSFLEIYGEDIYDLLSSPSRGLDKASLTVREDTKGMVFVQNLTESSVSSPEEALRLLHLGSRNRVTGATFMNASSSRSHAVYTITLEQKIYTDEDDQDSHQMVSKLTFVDLAGSERIKRTGADGQRMKEGIQINSGLFNLGQVEKSSSSTVINGLADDNRLRSANTKTPFIPYRNSKLTHLLKDALGGNSQTLFLACVSPAFVNESETGTTLQYARQARNIQNKPIKNMDPLQLELRRLKMATKEWMMRAVSLAFCDSRSSSLATLEDTEDLWRREDVQEYVLRVNKAISERVAGNAPTPRKIRLSVAPSPFSLKRIHPQTDHDRLVCAAARDIDSVSRDLNAGNWDVGSGFSVDDALEGASGSALGAIDTEEPERLLARMCEIFQQEKDLYEADNSGAIAEESIKQVENNIVEKEEILSKLMETVKSFAPLKSEYEKLLVAIGRLDSERKQLETELENAKKLSEKSSNVEKLNDRFVKVKEELDRMKNDRVQKENAIKLMQRNTAQADNLKRELQKLKEERASLMRKQKAQAQQYQKFQKDHSSKLQQLKKSDVKKQQLLNTLKLEVERKERLLGLKMAEMNRVTAKLKASERHIKILITNQIKGRGKGLSGKQDEKEKRNNRFGLNSDDSQRFEVAKSMLDTMVEDRVEEKSLRALLSLKIEEMTRINEELSSESAQLAVLYAKKDSLSRDQDQNGSSLDEETGLLPINEDIDNVLRAIVDIEVNMESATRESQIIETDIEDISDRLARLEKNSAEAADTGSVAGGLSWESSGAELISSLELGLCRALALSLVSEKIEVMDNLKATELDLIKLKGSLEQSEGKVRELEQRIVDVKAEYSRMLQQSEKQRVDDVWTVLKGNAFTATESGTESSTNPAIDVPIKRARELEVELEQFIANESVLKSQISEQRNQIAKMERRLQSHDVNARLQALTQGGGAGGVTSGQDCSPDSLVKELVDLWTQLGYPAEERQRSLQDMAALVARKKDETVQKLRSEISDVEGEIRDLEAILETGCDVLRASKKEFILTENTHEDSQPALLQNLAQLKSVVERLLPVLLRELNQFICSKDRLLDLLSETGIDVSELSPVLKSVMDVPQFSLTDDMITYDIRPILNQLQANSVFLGSEDFAAINSELRHLNANRVILISKMVPVIKDTKSLAEQLQIVNKAALLQIVDNGLKSSSAPMSVAVTLVFMDGLQNPPGNNSVFIALEQIHMTLKSVLVNRVNASRLAKEFISQLQVCLCLSDADLAIDRSAQDFDRSQLERLLAVVLQSSSLSKGLTSSMVERLNNLIPETFGLSPLHQVHAEARIASIQDAAARSPDGGSEAHLAAEAKMASLVEELVDLGEFCEEPWLRALVKDIETSWRTSSRHIHELVLLGDDVHKLQLQLDTVRELRRLDVALDRHISDMEAFETNSKAERAKVLSGSSKALIEEEKFRKNGKRKYEQLSEKIMSTYRQLRTLLGGEVPDMAFLGLKKGSQELLRGLYSERVELMHLHTITHGTRRWSNEDEAELSGNTGAGAGAAQAGSGNTAGVPIPASRARQGEGHSPPRGTLPSKERSIVDPVKGASSQPPLPQPAHKPKIREGLASSQVAPPVRNPFASAIDRAADGAGALSSDKTRTTALEGGVKAEAVNSGIEKKVIETTNLINDENVYVNRIL